MAADSIPTQTPDAAAPRATGLPARLGKIERTRLRLIGAVRAELEDAGQFTAEQVARRAETSPATFYNHFAGKDDALAAGFTAVMQDLVAHVDAHLRIDRVLDAGLDAFARDWVSACLAFFRANSATLRAAQAQLPASETLRRIFRAHEDEALERYVRFVRLGQQAGVFRRGDTTAIAHALMIQNEGWNHPGVLKLAPEDALHTELSRGVVHHLAGQGEKS